MQPNTDENEDDSASISQQTVVENKTAEVQPNSTQPSSNNNNNNSVSDDTNTTNNNSNTKRSGLTIVNIISRTPNIPSIPSLSSLNAAESGTKPTNDNVIAQSTDSIVTNNTDILSNSNDSVSSETPLTNNSSLSSSGETVKKVSPALQRLRTVIVPQLRNLNIEQLTAIANSQPSPTNQTTPTSTSPNTSPPSTSPHEIPPTRAPSLPSPPSLSIPRGRSFSLSTSPKSENTNASSSSSPRTHIHTPPPLATWDSLMSLIQTNHSPPSSPKGSVSEGISGSGSHAAALLGSSSSSRQRATSFRSPDQGGPLRHLQKKAMMEKLEQSQLIRDKKHKTLIERQHKRILYEMPRAVQMDLFEHAYPILLKSCQQYIKHLGNKHVVTLQAIKRLQYVANILGREYEL
eukprot:TRINITY_DN3810_c0_g1_i1.p1 TRINITY_DN3810_c0_g1~~TRINITY_DN3810_c0_g1_i1.p1  ORF type:complete len:404 (-),score=96.93 TRINITY_DN3810_c0_g1_i1:50-1261(-)